MLRQPFDRDWPTIPVALMLWLLGGVLLLTTLGEASISRVQEARVLVTARAMVNHPFFDGWMIPTTNGQIRLRKPPLAYWVAAVSMSILGETDVAGRIPFALSAWGTLGVVYAIGRKLFNSRMGFLSATLLAGTWLFARFARLAETDTLVTFWVVLGVYVTLLCLDSKSINKRVLLWILFGVVMAMAVMAKGLQAGMLLFIFVILLAIHESEHRTQSRRTSVTKNVIVPAIISIFVCLLIALPWFLYIHRNPEFGQLADDLENSAGGGKGHSNWFYVYFYMIPQFALPWSAVMVLSVISAYKLSLKDAGLRVIVIWILAIFVPLCFWGNKQFQYLMPLMPANMLLAGWLLDRWLFSKQSLNVSGATSHTTSSEQFIALLLSGVPSDGSDRVYCSRCTQLVVTATIFVTLFLAPAVIYIAHHIRHQVTGIDIAISTLWIAVAGLSWLLLMRQKHSMAVVVYSLGVAICMSAMIGIFAPSLDLHSPRTVASELHQRFGNSTYVFRDEEFLPLCFYMKQTIPIVKSDDELMKQLRSNPGLLGIERNKPESMKPIPTGLIEVGRFMDEDRVYRVISTER